MDLSITRAIGLLCIFSVILSTANAAGVPHGKRLYRSLPSVSRDHYSEILPDGTYKYAYTGQHRYVAERRLADGTVEGESLYIRPDGVPIKVHYFADGEGYRPQTEVLYADRLRNSARGNIVVPAPDVRFREVDPVVVRNPPVSTVLLAPNPNSVGVNLGDARTGEYVSLGNSGGDVAAALPSVTAIVGPGGHAEIRPEATAKTGGSRYFRSGIGNGDVAIARPSVTAIIGPGASAYIAPKANTYSGGADDDRVVIRPEVVRAVTHVERPVIAVPASRAPFPVAFPVVAPVVHAIRSAGVVVVPPSPSYSYSYSYSAPDEKNPRYGTNSAQVSVRVNQKKK